MFLSQSLRCARSTLFPSRRSSDLQVPRIASEKLAILDEARALRQLVVERSSGDVTLLGEPIHAARTRSPRPFFHRRDQRTPEDRKSTRLNSSHLGISYAVSCLTKK